MYTVEFHWNKAILAFINVEDYLSKAVDVVRREDEAVLGVGDDVGIVVPVACNDGQTGCECVDDGAGESFARIVRREKQRGVVFQREDALVERHLAAISHRFGHRSL